MDLSQRQHEPASGVIPQQELFEFCQKLERWGAQLPKEEQLLLQLMLSRVDGYTSGDIHLEEFRLPDIATSAKRALERIVGDEEVGEGRKMMAKPKPRPWVRGGPAWVRGGG